MYKREATEYDTDYVKKYDEDLNTTLIFVGRTSFAPPTSCLTGPFLQAGLFSAVSSAFVIDVHSGLQPDPNEQSAALLRAILLTLNKSAIPNEAPTVPPAQENPPSEIVTVTGLMYASLLISLLAAFTAMLGKQWLNRYLRNTGGSMIERCGDRQRKCDGLKKWPFHLFIESLPVMLQVALLLLACGLCKHMAFINTTVAGVLITLTVLGVLFYLGMLIVGASSYECPFQTPLSTTLHSVWETTRPHMVAILSPIIATGVSLYMLLPWSLALAALHSLWETIQCQILHVVLWLPPITLWYHSHSPFLPVVQATPQQPTSWLASLQNLWENIQRRIFHVAPHLPQTQPPTDSIVLPHSLWLAPPALTALYSTNANDVRCTSWILWNITDPEALDAAIRLAATIHWFEDGLNAEPPYDQIISILKGCFDSDGKVYPGSRDRAYYSAQAVLWIHICAMFKSKKFGERFSLPTISWDNTSLDPDLGVLLYNYRDTETSAIIDGMYFISTACTPACLQWTSNALLHLSWAHKSVPGIFGEVSPYYSKGDMKGIPLNAVLNHLLVMCIFLGWPIGEEVLKIQDKSYVIYHLCFSTHSLLFLSGHFNQILSQFSKAMVSAINTSHPQCELLKDTLTSLCDLENKTPHLTELAYEWCSVICRNYSSLRYGKDLLLLSLQIGFSHLDPKRYQIDAKLTHTEHHKGMAAIIFDSGDQEAIADLLNAWTSRSSSHGPFTSLHICIDHLIGLHRWTLSPRLRQFIIYTIQLIGYQPFEVAGVEGFIGLLNSLQVHVEDINSRLQWTRLLLNTIQSSEGAQHLSLQYWELLGQLVVSCSQYLGDNPYNPNTITSLKEVEEWDKLKYWVGTIWMVWPPEGGKTTEKDLEHVMLLLFHQQPGAVQEIKEQMKQWSGWPFWNNIPLSFQQICRQVEIEARQQVIL